MDKYTERTIRKLLAKPLPHKPILVNCEGRLLKADDCASKTRTGVKYNRLVRLRRRLAPNPQ